jgi:two-component system nitrate/nitrite response regulator NarL
VGFFANSERRIRVLIADGSLLRSQLLADGLGGDDQFEIATAEASEQVLQCLVKNPFEVLLVSSGHGENGASGLQIAREAWKVCPALSIVFLMDVLERQAVIEAFRCGARGVIGRSDSLESLRKCIVRVTEGQVWASSAQLDFLLEALVEPMTIENDGESSARPLSKREEEIARLVAEGCSNRQISERLKLSEHTIKNYLFRVFEKLGVSTRVELTLYALNRGRVPRSRARADGLC